MRQALSFVLAAPSTVILLITLWGKVHTFISSKPPITVNTLKQTHVQIQELQEEGGATRIRGSQDHQPERPKNSYKTLHSEVSGHILFLNLWSIYQNIQGHKRNPDKLKRIKII